MGNLRLILRSVAHYRRAHLGLMAGTLLASAILSGALVVGDSVDHTLRTFALQRLGKAGFAITSGDRLFADALGGKLQERLKSPVASVFALPGMAIFQNAETGMRTQVNRVQALGVDETFWSLGEGAPVALARREAALDERLAARLGVKAGDTVALRIAKPGLLSRDAPLSSREEDTSERANFTVKAIVPDSQMGRFGLAPSQIPPANFFVALADLQQLAGSVAQANLLLVADGGSVDAIQGALKESWSPEFSGLSVTARAEGTLQLESNRIFLDDATAEAALSLPGAQGALTYLVNALQSGDHSTPYSFMTASDALTEGLGDEDMVINEWLAQQLKVTEGAKVTVKYFEVLPSNRFEERSKEFTVRRILPMAAFENEKLLVPNFPGLSNVESCADWKIGMPMDEQLLKDPANEAYWKEHRQTPKALVTLKAGRALWGNRFGSLTGVRFAADATAEKILAQLSEKMEPRDVGLEVRPVREEAAAAAAQAMDLGGLFLGLSFFLLGSALILTGLLYAFSAQQRAQEVGILSALGFSRGRIRILLLAETTLVAIPGAVLGAGFGMAYAWALMFGLAQSWQNAIGRIPLIFAVQPDSIVIGIVATLVCALITAWLTLRRLLRHGASELMNADFTQAYRLRTRKWSGFAGAGFCLFAAVASVVYAFVSPPPDVAELFFSSGALALIAGLLFAQQVLARPKADGPAQRPTMVSMALLNATRRRGRSMAMVSSLAAGGFLVLAVSSMQTDVGANADKRWSGTGGFALYGESTVPILEPAQLDAAAPGVKALGLRVYDGDDASCLNLNHALRPRVLGVDAAQLASLKAFVDEADSGLWDLLNSDLGEGVLPALVGDSDTAMWTLKKTTGPENGDSLGYRDAAGRDVSLKLVGRLPMRLSVFQGTVLVSAANFTKLWPSQEGFRAFLIDGPADSLADSIDRLQGKFDRYGLDVAPSVARLEMFHAVECTYLSMFLVLGGVGLLLGASATGVVVLRNLLERRREIAVLRAVGFSPSAVFRLLATEYGALLVIGVTIATAASAVSMLPALTSAHGDPATFSRLFVLAVVFGCAGLCAFVALVVGLRKTNVDDLRAE